MHDFEERLAHLRKARRNVRPQELDNLLHSAGFTGRQGRAQEIVYSHPSLEAPFAIPQGNPVLPTYVSRAIREIERVIG
jgi:hypothetical protein